MESKELRGVTEICGGKKNPDTPQYKAQQYLENCCKKSRNAKFLENQIRELEAMSQYSSPPLTDRGGGNWKFR